MENVKQYTESHSIQRRDASDVIEEFSDELAEMRGKCLDIGCGPGHVTRDLLLPKLHTQATLVGADISKSMIDFARSTHADEERLSFTELNVETEQLPSSQIEAYDNAVSFYCLHWCQDIRRVCENIYQMLKPGGKSLLLFLAYNSGFDGYLKLHDDPQYAPYMKDMAKYIPYFQNSANPRASFKKMLEESGFQVLHCSFREKTFVFKNLQDLKKHAVAVNPFIHRMPDDLREQFEDDLLREIASRKICFVNTENGSAGERAIMDRYYVLIAHFKKPLI